MKHEALLYQKLSENRVQCQLCAHRCVIAAGQRGICRVRENRDGNLETLVYGRTISCHADPIEKKPLYHFFPGSRSLSIATPGCNFRCAWCQNWEISQLPRGQQPEIGQKLSPQEIVDRAVESGCRSIAYTYTEPTIFFEYSFSTARLAHQAGLANVYVSNGYMTPEMLKLIHPYLDAVNIDLKAFRDDTYRTHIGARLQPVLDSLKLIRDYGIWLEVTTLLVPGVNDDPGELGELADFICRELGEDVPWHVSRYFPSFEMSSPGPTSPDSLRKAAQIGRDAGLNHVYVGNLHNLTETHCPACRALLIRRESYNLTLNRVGQGGCCPDCHRRVAGVGMGP